MIGFIIFGMGMWIVSGILTGLFVHSCGPLVLDMKEFIGIIFIWPVFIIKYFLKAVAFMITSIPAALKVFSGQVTSR